MSRPFVDPPERGYPERVHAEQHPAKPRMRLTGIPLALALSAPLWLLMLAAARWIGWL